MKKIIVPILVVAMLFMFCACNYQFFDTQFNYDYAIVNFGGTTQYIEIDKWTDYEGEQLQILDKDGNVYLVNSMYTMFVKENNDGQ